MDSGHAERAPPVTKSAVTIPRLELCAVVLGVEISRIIQKQLNIAAKDFHLHTDSKVVLGYIYNTTRRFYTYVSNRIEQIHKFSAPTQWSYVPSQHNPADQGTKPILPEAMKESLWLHGPKSWTADTFNEKKIMNQKLTHLNINSLNLIRTVRLGHLLQ